MSGTPQTGSVGLRQQVLVLYLASSALDSRVVGWSHYDGTGRTEHMAGDQSEPPYHTGLAALRDGWRLIQASPLLPHTAGDEFRTGYLKYEFFFEKLAQGCFEKLAQGCFEKPAQGCSENERGDG